MRHLSLTAEDMADLIAGSTINVPLEDGEEIIVSAPDGVNEDWRDHAETVPGQPGHDTSWIAKHRDEFDTDEEN